ncbi:MazG-like family protein, partial [Tardiphaga sp.]|uniref:MazG-like family protein n=1 Tax=Tardiphaga sp. TaxID=1926292 RepID=UPI0037D9FF70
QNDRSQDRKCGRQAEWDSGNQITVTYRANELAGEMGEACNIIKKLERERLGIRGSRATVEQLAEELADVVICADLIAMGVGRPMEVDSGMPVGLKNGAEWGSSLAREVGRLCENVLYDRGRIAEVHCESVERVTRAIAAHYDIDLNAAIVAKFNATSEKVGLKTRMEVIS